MKEKKTRFIVLPFYMGCLSQTSTCEKDSSSSSMVKLKRSWSYVAPRRSNITKTMDRLIRLTFKSFAQVFAYKDIEDIKTEKEMVIGFPTDVKHVTHIGYDGSMTTNTDKNWDHFQLEPLETLSFPSVSLKQPELPMATPAEAP